MGISRHKLLLITTILPLLLSACLPEDLPEPTPPITNTPIPPTSTYTPTSTPTDTPTPEPTKTIAELGYKMKIGDIECSLTQQTETIFLAECPETIYMPLNSSITIELIPPATEEYKLYVIDRFAELVEKYFPGVIVGGFVESLEVNQAGCWIPYSDKAGEEIVCGFSFENLNEISILVKGVTIRVGGGSSSNSGGSSGSSGNGWVPPTDQPGK